MAAIRENVLIVGATGYTGSQIAAALAKSDRFNVQALIRAGSLTKPATEELRVLGVSIIQGDILTDSAEKLEKILSGIDVLISTVLIRVEQRPLLLAAKKAGVKRVVPSDFGPYIPRGVTAMQDAKLDIRDFIIEHSIPYTFIEVGIWINNLLPLPHSSNGYPLPESGKIFVGSGQLPVTWTDYSNIGHLVRLTLEDSGTLNKTVHLYDGETTLEEAWDVGAKISGEDFSDYARVNAEQVEEKIGLSSRHKAIYGYCKALLVRGDSSIAKAVTGGSLDCHKLYPEYEPPTLVESAMKFYEDPPTFTYEVSSRK
ncbi:NAD(P)-binding protein [Flagelloscypha sp. PMI_526]|nr:NAD(P)-binding protein [Flagelloscypha sp. PMI_526]